MIIRAEYTPRLASEYKDNAFVEALPPRMAWPAFFSRFRLSHAMAEEDRWRPSPKRLELLDQITSFFVPMTHHFELNDLLLSKMERSYIGRDPSDPRYWIGVKKKRAVVVKASVERRIPVPRGRSSAGLLGDSGLGKTEVLKMILSIYPAAIKHGRYKDCVINCIQIPCVRIEVDKNSTVTGLCDQVFDCVDRILGKGYKELYKRLHEQGKMAGVVTVCHLHGIALIVVDELQEMSLKKSKGEDAIVSFMLNLANTAGPFVLFVGTPQAKLLTRPEFHHIRRQSSIPKWTPFLPRSGDWRDFLDELFKCRLTRGAFDGESLRNAFYDLTRGIPDLAIELFQRTQAKLILHEGPDNPETITPEFLEKIANVYLSREMAAIAAADKLAEGSKSKSLREKKLALEGAQDFAADLELPKRPTETSLRQSPSLNRGQANESSEPEPASKAGATDPDVEPSLCEIAGIKGEDKLGNVAQLRGAGVIKSPLEFLGK